MATSKSDKEELLSNLSTYKLQLQQVEAALTTDPDNDDLLKLKNDLEEVINLTEDLVSTQVGPSAATSSADDDLFSVPKYAGRGLAAAGTREDDDDDDYDNNDDDDEVEAAKAWLSSDFKSGDKCRAPWTDASGETSYYPATIDEILEDGTCSVVFERYGSTEVTKVTLLRPPASDQQEENSNKKHPTSKKGRMQAEREYKRKKAQKKQQRLKQYEEERESDKNKWLSFNSKIFSKTSKGRVKKSIFASRDLEATGVKVGAGTSGVTGRPMTKYTHIARPAHSNAM